MKCLLCARRDGVAMVGSMMDIGLMASGSLLSTAEWQDQSTPQPDTPFSHTGDPPPLLDLKPGQEQSYK